MRRWYRVLGGSTELHRDGWRYSAKCGGHTQRSLGVLRDNKGGREDDEGLTLNTTQWRVWCCRVHPRREEAEGTRSELGGSRKLHEDNSIFEMKFYSLSTRAYILLLWDILVI